MLALFLLVTATVLGVYKPFGMTAYGRQKREAQRFSSTALPRHAAQPANAVTNTPRRLVVCAAIALGVLLLFLLLHLVARSAPVLR
jgi:hypothetical protein